MEAKGSTPYPPRAGSSKGPHVTDPCTTSTGLRSQSLDLAQRPFSSRDHNGSLRHSSSRSSNRSKPRAWERFLQQFKSTSSFRETRTDKSLQGNRSSMQGHFSTLETAYVQTTAHSNSSDTQALEEVPPVAKAPHKIDTYHLRRHLRSRTRAPDSIGGGRVRPILADVEPRDADSSAVVLWSPIPPDKQEERKEPLVQPTELITKPLSEVVDALSIQIADLQTQLKEAEQKVKDQAEVHAADIQAMETTHADEIQTKDERIKRLRNKVTSTEAAITAANAQGPQSQLRRAESEIIKDWQSLAYDVRNFVDNYLKTPSQGSLSGWAQDHATLLRGITPSYERFVGSRKAAGWLIRAAIWRTLWKEVFGESFASSQKCWAGGYRVAVKGLSSAFAQAIPPANPEKQRIFHQWKAATTSLINTVGPQMSDGRDEPTWMVVQDLVELLEALHGPQVTRPSFRQALKSLVKKAVALDEVFCGQLGCYSVLYPEQLAGARLDEWTMKVPEESSTLHPVAFMIQPCLIRAGGIGGAKYDQDVLLDRAVVWTA